MAREVARVLALAEILAIGVCAYAVMSNHHHLVLHINKAKALQWTNHEVCERWHQLYKGALLTQNRVCKLEKDTCVS